MSHVPQRLAGILSFWDTLEYVGLWGSLNQAWENAVLRERPRVTKVGVPFPHLLSPADNAKIREVRTSVPGCRGEDRRVWPAPLCWIINAWKCILCHTLSNHACTRKKHTDLHVKRKVVNYNPFLSGIYCFMSWHIPAVYMYAKWNLLVILACSVKGTNTISVWNKIRWIGLVLTLNRFLHVWHQLISKQINSLGCYVEKWLRG